MKHFTKFSEFIKESYNEIVNEEAGPKTDCHEIMTACLCTLPLTKIKSMISKVESNQEAIPGILSELSRIAIGNKILGASEDDKGSIMTFQYKELALLQALSAAKAILENNSGLKVSEVILTGKSWLDQISKFSGIRNLQEFFGIDSYGMKDFNSSDIVLVSKSKGEKIRFVGVSLKKKKIGEKDPTLINRSLFDSLPTKARDELEEAFNDFFNTVLSKNSKNLIGDSKVLTELMAKRKTILSAKYPNYLSPKDFENEESLKSALLEKCKSANKNPNKRIWRNLLSQSVGLMITHDNREHIRKIVNPMPLGDKSPFRKVEQVLTNEGVSAEIALALMEIIFKGQLYALMDARFSFALCTGIGKLGKRIGAVVGPGEYEPIENITTEMERLKNSGQPSLKLVRRNEIFESGQISKSILFEDDSEDPDNNEITVFLKLMVGDESLAVISIRYKGRYTESPDMLATMYPSFKEKLVVPVLAKVQDTNGKE